VAETPEGKGEASAAQMINLDHPSVFWMTDLLRAIREKCVSDLGLIGKYGMH